MPIIMEGDDISSIVVDILKASKAEKFDICHKDISHHRICSC